MRVVAGVEDQRAGVAVGGDGAVTGGDEGGGAVVAEERDVHAVDAVRDRQRATCRGVGETDAGAGGVISQVCQIDRIVRDQVVVEGGLDPLAGIRKVLIVGKEVSLRRVPPSGDRLRVRSFAH